MTDARSRSEPGSHGHAEPLDELVPSLDHLRVDHAQTDMADDASDHDRQRVHRDLHYAMAPGIGGGLP